MMVVDTTRFDMALDKLRRSVGVEFGRELLKEEGRQLIKTVIRLDNKLAMLGVGSLPSNRPASRGTQGVRAWAVERAIIRTMDPLDTATFVNDRWRKAIERLSIKGDVAALNRLFERIKNNGSPLKNAKVVSFSPAHHKSNIHPTNGHTSRTRYLILAQQDRAQWKDYVKLVQARVGYKFSGFLAAADTLGLKTQAWVNRHPRTAGRVGFGTAGMDDYLEIINNSSKDRRLTLRVENALSTRAKAMMSKTRRVVAGQATNLGFTTFNPEGMTLAEYKSTPDYIDSLKALSDLD